jgi:toxin ParE1/3/4
MERFSVIIQPEAEQDLDETFVYFENQQSGLGFKLLADLVEVMELLEENPFLFQKVYGEQRRAVIQRFGYNVIYKIMGSDVFILAIMYGGRDTKKWEERS